MHAVASPSCNHTNIIGVPTLSKNSLLGSSVVFGDSTDSVNDDKVPVKYIIENLSNALRNKDHRCKTKCCTIFHMI